MIRSRTKYQATSEEISCLFEDNGIGKVIRTALLGDGEFNAAFQVTCGNGKDYVLKIAPPENAMRNACAMPFLAESAVRALESTAARIPQ